MERLVSFYCTSYFHSRGVSCSFPVLCMTTYGSWRLINFQKSAHVCSYGVLRWYDRYVWLCFILPMEKYRAVIPFWSVCNRKFNVNTVVITY